MSNSNTPKRNRARDEQSKGKLKEKGHKRKRISGGAFVQRLYDIVNDQSNNEIISWSDCGEEFIIKNIVALQEQVLHKYFESVQYDSFKRQLFNYGFKTVKIIRKDDRGLSFQDGVKFYRESFRRGADKKNLAEIQSKRARVDPSNRIAHLESKVQDMEVKLKRMEEVHTALKSYVVECMREYTLPPPATYSRQPSEPSIVLRLSSFPCQIANTTENQSASLPPHPNTLRSNLGVSFPCEIVNTSATQSASESLHPNTTKSDLEVDKHTAALPRPDL